MRKLYVAAALGAVALFAVTAASGAAAKGPLKVHGKVALTATPTNTPDSKGKPHTTSVVVNGKVKSQSTCLGGRKIVFTLVTPAGSFVQSVTSVSTRNGSFTATLPFTPTGLNSKSTGTAVTASASASQVTRKDKDSGDKVKCLESSGINDFTVVVT
jgi:hypothetical protein